MNDETSLIALLGRSRLSRVVERSFQVLAAAGQASFTRRALDNLMGPPADRPTNRVRLAGYAAISAAATRAALGGVDLFIASPGSGFGWVALALLAVACVRRPEAVLRAWSRWKVLRPRRS